ncbi:OstA family protein [Bartonella australis AUST/NH1]|uniref:OstA family protein n=1 Tax=Bartonella australis (strain Aust/NH1) TaxID=1094489 RepID=M1N1X7_BARAA|nr:LptA/OstA family protein [Bartonella australis]AGF73909.1 OstA family protein [Bartonella australis AUST/NH1]
MKSRMFRRKWVGVHLTLNILMLGPATVYGYAEAAQSGVGFLNGKEPIELHADSLEVRDKEGVALFKGNVSVIQGERLLRTSELTVYYGQVHEEVGAGRVGEKSALPVGGGDKDIRKMEASGEVYIKIDTRIATGDKGIFDEKSKTVVLTGKEVALIDGNNVAKGCKLTVNTKTGRAFLEGCKTSEKKGRISVILKPN